MSPRVHARICLALPVALAAFVPLQPAVAQVIQGRIVDQSGQPVSVALLTVLDERGSAVRTGLSGDGGTFSISTGQAGLFAIRVERIGFEGWTSAPVELAAGERRTLMITVSAAPVMLAEIRAETRRRCLTRPGDGGTIARIWDEARKALQITAAAESGGAVPLAGVRYIRELDAAGRRQTSVRSRTDFTTRGVPFDAVPIEALARLGFAALEDDRTTLFFGPSAAVLLSDAFLDHHCFTQMVGSRTSPGMIGLSFEPVRGNRLVGLAGTMWLDRETAELKTVEYEYSPVDERLLHGARGRIEFARLADGLPHVSRWWIRMPLALEDTRRPDGRARVVAWLEEGGIVLDARGAEVNADDGVLAALNAAIEADERFARREVSRATIDSIAGRAGTIEDVLGRFGQQLRVERGHFWSYDHGPEEIVCVEAASPLPRSAIAVGGIVRSEAFCDALPVYLDGSELEAPGVALRAMSLGNIVSIEYLGSEIATRRLGTRLEGPALFIVSR